MHFIAYVLRISHIFLVSCGSHISFTNTPDQVILEEDSTNDQDSTLPDPPFLAPTLQRTATDSQGRIYIKESTITEKSAFSVDPRIIAYYGLNEANASDNTTLSDMTGNNDGTLETNNGTDNKLFSAKVGNGLSLDGDNDGVLIPYSTDFDLAGDYQIAVWVYPLSYGEGNYGRIIDHYGSTGWELNIDGSDEPNSVSMWYSPNIRVLSAHENSVRLNRWTHIAYTVNSGTMTVYINGELSNSTTGVSAPQIQTGPVAIGKRSQAANRFFDGTIDELGIWNRAFSSEEIRSLYKLQIG